MSTKRRVRRIALGVAAAAMTVGATAAGVGVANAAPAGVTCVHLNADSSQLLVEAQLGEVNTLEVFPISNGIAIRDTAGGTLRVRQPARGCAQLVPEQVWCPTPVRQEDPPGMLPPPRPSVKLELGDRDDSVVSTLTIGVIADLGFGNDRFDGSAGAGASVYGGFGQDVVIGGRSGDYLAGGNDNDRVTGNAGDDLIELGEGHDWSDGGWGRDTIFGGIGSDTIYGGAGNDHLQGSGEGIVDDFEADDDRIFGQIGSDELWGEKGNDYLHAGVGTDQYVDGGEHRDVCLGLDVDKTACES